MKEKLKEVEFTSEFLSELRKKAKPLPMKIRKALSKPQKKHPGETFLSTYDTSSLKIEIE